MNRGEDRDRRAFFMLGERGGKIKSYPHSAILIAEGLVELGWKISSNLSLWQQYPDGPFLFPGDGYEMIEDAELVIYEEDYFLLQSKAFAPTLPGSNHAAKIYLDRSDLLDPHQTHSSHPGLTYSKDFRNFDLILRCHSNSSFLYPRNVSPMVFGISQRIARACAPTIVEKNSNLIWNFRHSKHPHTARRWADKHIRPIISPHLTLDQTKSSSEETQSDYAMMMQRQTENRHSTSYYADLRRALACACFGGWFLLRVRHEEASRICFWNRAVTTRLSVATSLIAQWDSWRLWEAFASGAAVMHFDFAQCGFLLGGPLPEPYVHYIPVSLSNPAKKLIPILEDRRLMQQIGENGRRWAMQHYTSPRIAQKMLDILGSA